MAKIKLIDLGLPSGTKWADRNVGAENAESEGIYVAWGGTQGKTSYFVDNYEFNNVVKEYHEEEVTIYPERYEKIEVAGETMYKSLLNGKVVSLPEGWEYDEETMYIWNPADPSTKEPHVETVEVCVAHKEITKYNGQDGKFELESVDDAATVVEGNYYETPSKAQWEELFENCKMTINGTLATFTSPNGHFIVLPLAGCKHEDFKCQDVMGEYWAKNLNAEDCNYAFRTMFSSSLTPSMEPQWKILGLQIRPVGK